jgi:predicted polyphosphate/ATP-dependent NAD kinase
VSARRLGLIVNPVAGMGGAVGLKGSDGADTQRRARELGAVPRAPARAAEALRAFGSLPAEAELVTWSGEMGANAARQAGLAATVVGESAAGGSSAEDTRRAARALAALGVELLLFAGGDGTARDVYDAVGERVLALGIPAGVKIHSAVYATTPRAAGDLAARVLAGQARRARQAEVMDLDEEEFRRGRVSAQLYGYLRVPEDRTAVQSLKSASPPGEEASLAGIAADVIEGMQPGWLYLVGPGTTTRPILTSLGLDKMLLGVDVVQDRAPVARDVGERELLRLLDGRPARIVVTPIGGQGYIFGRGNQQLSPAVIRRVGRDNILVVATRSKLAALRGEPLLVDSGDEETDALLRGYHSVVTGYRERAICRVR